jgi:hypothetical protein
MPVLAFLLGIGAAGETLTIGAIAGLILIALGAWLATARHRQARTEDSETTARPARHHSPAASRSSGPAGHHAKQADSSATRPCATTLDNSKG